jgi:hypothetical protein
VKTCTATETTPIFAIKYSVCEFITTSSRIVAERFRIATESFIIVRVLNLAAIGDWSCNLTGITSPGEIVILVNDFSEHLQVSLLLRLGFRDQMDV